MTDENKINYTEKEKIFMSMLLTIGRTIIDTTNSLSIGSDEYFDCNDLYYLACKLGLEDIY